MLQPSVGPLYKQDDNPLYISLPSLQLWQGKDTRPKCSLGDIKVMFGLAPSIGVRRDLYASSVKNNNKTKMTFYNHLYLLLPTLTLW